MAGTDRGQAGLHRLNEMTRLGPAALQFLQTEMSERPWSTTGVSVRSASSCLSAQNSFRLGCGSSASDGNVHAPPSRGVAMQRESGVPWPVSDTLHPLPTTIARRLFCALYVQFAAVLGN